MCGLIRQCKTPRCNKTFLYKAFVNHYKRKFQSMFGKLVNSAFLYCLTFIYMYHYHSKITLENLSNSNFFGKKSS